MRSYFKILKRTLNYEKTMKSAVTIMIFILLHLNLVLEAKGAIIEIFPSNADYSCNEEFENVANTLKPGDELVLHGGIYSQDWFLGSIGCVCWSGWLRCECTPSDS